VSRNLHLRLGATFGRVNKLASNEQQSLRGTEWGSAQRVANGGGGGGGGGFIGVDVVAD